MRVRQSTPQREIKSLEKTNTQSVMAAGLERGKGVGVQLLVRGGQRGFFVVVVMLRVEGGSKPGAVWGRKLLAIQGHPVEGPKPGLLLTPPVP